jgi:hypothetical protein
VTEEIRELIKKSFESNEMKYNLPDMWDPAKAVLREKFTAISAYIKKEKNRDFSNK